MSYVTSSIDTSLFLQVLAQIDPANVTAVSLMNDVFSNQLQLAESVINLQYQGINVDANLHQLGEVAAMNTLLNVLPGITKIKTELENIE